MKIYLQSKLPEEQRRPIKKFGKVPKAEAPEPKAERHVAPPVAQETIASATSEYQVSPIQPTSKELEARLRELESALADARRREKEAAQAQAQAAQREVLTRAVETFIPLTAKLRHHLREIERIQRAYGPTLRDFARSCASDMDPQVRRKVTEVNSAAGPLGQRLGDARHTIEQAIRGVTLASESVQPHVHEQARVLGDAALAINLIALETDCKTLINIKRDLRGGYLEVGRVTGNIIEPSRFSEVSPLGDTAQF